MRTAPAGVAREPSAAARMAGPERLARGADDGDLAALTVAPVAVLDFAVDEVRAAMAMARTAAAPVFAVEAALADQAVDSAVLADPAVLVAATR